MKAREFMSGCSEELLTSLAEAARDAEPVSGFTHNFYRYPARFSPKFVRAAISALSEPGDLILDPFMGGGTTLVEALALGRHAIGVDISSLAAFLSQVKTTLYSDDDLDILKRWAAHATSQIHMHREGAFDERFAENGYYRHMDNRSTWRLRKAIEQSLKSVTWLGSPKLERFARCAILRTGQWALDGRKRLPTISGFRQMLEDNAFDMIEGARELRFAAVAAREGQRPVIHCLNRPTAGTRARIVANKDPKTAACPHVSALSRHPHPLSSVAGGWTKGNARAVLDRKQARRLRPFLLHDGRPQSPRIEKLFR